MKPLHDGERHVIEAESVPPGHRGWVAFFSGIFNCLSSSQSLLVILSDVFLWVCECPALSG